MKYRNTIPVKPVYRKDEIVTNVKETAISQMVSNSLEILRRRIGDLHNTESTYPATLDPKYITDLSRAIGGMHNVIPPLDKAKLLAYTPYLYMKLKDSTYNVIPHPDQEQKCSVGCIYDRYDQATLQMKCAKDQPSTVYRAVGDIICQNSNCQFWSGNPTTIRDVTDVPDNVAVDKLRKYKIVFPTEQRLTPHASIKYYEDCGTSFGEPERGDATYYNEGDCSVTGDIYNPSDTYACQTDNKYVWYKFGSEDDKLSKNDAVYYLVMEFPGLGESATVTVEVSPDGPDAVGGGTWYEIDGSPFSVSGNEPTLYQYEIPTAYYFDVLYVRFTPTITAPTQLTDTIREPTWSIHEDQNGKYLLFATCYPQRVPGPGPKDGTSNLFLYDLGSDAPILSDRIFQITNITNVNADVFVSNAKFNPVTFSKIVCHASWNSWDSMVETPNRRMDLWKADLVIGIDADGRVTGVTTINELRITNEATYSSRAPDWCPDGIFVAYQKDINSSAKGSDIYIINSNDNTRKYRITKRNGDTLEEQTLFCLYPHWHPTSRDANGNYNKILFTQAPVVWDPTYGVWTPVIDSADLYEVTIHWEWDAIIGAYVVDESTTQLDITKITTYVGTPSNPGAHQYGTYSPDGTLILFDSRRAGRVDPWNPAFIHFDYYIMNAEPEGPDNPAYCITTSDMGDCEWGAWGSEGTHIIMQSNMGDYWDFDGDVDGDGNPIIAADAHRPLYQLYSLSRVNYTGGFVSQLWLIESLNKRHYNYGEQLFLPTYLSRVTPYNEYPKNSMFLYDTTANTTLEHVKFFSTYFNYFEDSIELHRDCVDVFLYNDQALEVSDTRYLIYTAGTGLADVAGGLLDDYINHVNNEDMHLTAEDVCRVINDPTLCCKYDNNTATVEFDKSVGVSVYGYPLRNELDNFEAGKTYMFKAEAFGENVPADTVIKWYIKAPDESTTRIYTNPARFQFFYKPGTWTFSVRAIVEIGGTYRTIGATEGFTVYVKPSSTPVTLDYDTFRPACALASPCCTDGYPYGYAYIMLKWIHQDGLCYMEPDATYNLPEIVANLVGHTKYAEHEQPLNLYWMAYIQEKVNGTHVRVNLTNWGPNPPLDLGVTGGTFSKIRQHLFDGDQLCTVGHSGMKLGQAVHEYGGGLLFIEFMFVIGYAPYTKQWASLVWQCGINFGEGKTPWLQQVNMAIPSRTCEYSPTHTYTNPSGLTYNTIYLGANLYSEEEEPTRVLCGLYYDIANGVDIGIETVMTPIIAFPNIGELYELKSENSLLTAMLLVPIIQAADGYATWYYNLDDQFHTLRFDMFDYSLLDMYWSEVYHGMTPQNAPNTIVGINKFVYNGHSYNSEVCWVCNTPTTHSPVIPNPDNWVGNDPNNTHTRSFNFYPITNGWAECGSLCDACFTDGAYKRGSGYYSLTTLRPCRNTSSFSEDEPQFGQSVGVQRSIYFTHTMSPIEMPMGESNPGGEVLGPIGYHLVDVSSQLRAMLKMYYDNSSLYHKATAIGVRFRNPFPYNNSTKENRYVEIGLSQMTLAYTCIHPT